LTLKTTVIYENIHDNNNQQVMLSKALGLVDIHSLE